MPEAPAPAPAAPAPAPAAATAAPAPAAPPTPAAPAAPPASFADSLPEDIRTDGVFRDIKDLAGLAKSYHHAAKMIGRDPKTLFSIPGPDDAAGWEKLHNALGRPAEAGKYELGKATLPEGLTLDETLQKGFTETAHKLGLTNKQAAGLFEWWNGYNGEQYKAGAAALAKAAADGEIELKNEWGAAYKERLDLAHRALAHYAEALGSDRGNRFVKHLEDTGLGNNPTMVMLFSNLGKALVEDGVIGKANGEIMQSPTEALQEIDAKRRDSVFMKQYMDKREAGHEDAKRIMGNLYALAYPRSA